MGGRVNGLRKILATGVRVGLGTDERGSCLFAFFCLVLHTLSGELHVHMAAHNFNAIESHDFIFALKFLFNAIE